MFVHDPRGYLPRDVQLRCHRLAAAVLKQREERSNAGVAWCDVEDALLVGPKPVPVQPVPAPEQKPGSEPAKPTSVPPEQPRHVPQNEYAHVERAHNEAASKRSWADYCSNTGRPVTYGTAAQRERWRSEQ